MRRAVSGAAATTTTTTPHHHTSRHRLSAAAASISTAASGLSSTPSSSSSSSSFFSSTGSAASGCLGGALRRCSSSAAQHHHHDGKIDTGHLPQWLQAALSGPGSSIGKPEPYRFPGWPAGLDPDVKARLSRGDPAALYQKVDLGDGAPSPSSVSPSSAPGAATEYCFNAPQDNPYEGVGDSGIPTALWFECAKPDEPKLMLQLAPQFPPLLWIPVKPKGAAVAKLLTAFSDNDEGYLERAASQYERYLTAGEDAIHRDARYIQSRVESEGGAFTPPPAALRFLEESGYEAPTPQPQQQQQQQQQALRMLGGDPPAAPQAVAAIQPAGGLRRRSLAHLLDVAQPQPVAVAVAEVEVEEEESAVAPAPPGVQERQQGQQQLTPVSPQYALGALTPYGAFGSPVDLHRRAAGGLAVLSPAKEYSGDAWYHLGTAVSPEDVEIRMMGNPFVFGRWPAAVVGGEQRRGVLPDAVHCSSFRTVFSKSSVFFTTRDDEPHVSVNVKSNTYRETSTLYCHVDSPESMYMSGGRQVVERFNREFGTDYPLTTPVDVLGALALFQCKAVTQVEAEYRVAAGGVLDMTRDASLEVAKRQKKFLTDDEKKYVGALETLSASADPIIAPDASHPSLVKLVQYIRQLAVMKYPRFEEDCFRPFWSNESKFVRIRVHEACLVAGRADLAQLMLSRESDPYVVNQCCDVSPKNVSS